jgi:RNA polymerase sigma factor (sigma-70 family)
MTEVDYPQIKAEALLIEGCIKGNSKAQYRLYSNYSRAMYNLAYRMMNNREDAEDILQETFLECFRNIGSFRFESAFGAWLKRILINKCMNHLRKKKSELVLYESLPPDEAEEDSEIQYDTSRIFKAIELLPDGYRIVLTLYLLEGYDHAEIAKILEIAESTSKSQYSRAKSRLRRVLTEK